MVPDRTSMFRTLLSLKINVWSVLSTLCQDPARVLRFIYRLLPLTAGNLIIDLLASATKKGALRGIVLYIGGRNRDAYGQLAYAKPGKLQCYLERKLSREPEFASELSVTSESLRHWEIGNMKEAILCSRPSSIEHRRWKGIARVLAPDFDPYVKLPQSSKIGYQVFHRNSSGRISRDRIRALHYLTNALPEVQSGYTVRSQSILLAQSQFDIEPIALTRPVLSGLTFKPRCAKKSTVNGVTYLHQSGPHRTSNLDQQLRERYVHLLTAVEKLHPHIIHTTTNFENALVVNAVAREKGIPWVYETRGEMEKTWLSRKVPTDYKTALNSEYYRAVRAVEVRMMQAADAVVALSQVQKASHIARGIRAEKIVVIENSVDDAVLEIPYCSPKSARKTLNLPEAFTIGTVSALVDYEGIDHLVDAIAILRSRGYDIRGLIVGDGPSTPVINRRIAEQGLRDYITSPGTVPTDEVRSWYQALDVFCVPRRDLDVTRVVTPIKPLQAMALGRPVVVSALPALEEITSKRGAGIAVSAGSPTAFADAIERIATNPSCYRQFSEQAREAAEDLTWSKAAERYYELYCNLIASGQPN